MNLCEAVKNAFKQGKCIAVPELYGEVKIRPTDGEGCCIVSRWDGSKPTHWGWQPQATDFLREDWMVID